MQPSPFPLAIIASPEQRSRAEQLAVALNLPLLECAEQAGEQAELLLQCDQQGISLQLTGRGAPGPVRVDFVSGAQSYRRLSGGAELVARACGVERGRSPSVLDATAGLGRDSLVLASRGARVLMLERSAAVAALLEDGMQRAMALGDASLREVMARMRLRQQDARDYLQALPVDDYPDVILIDPMFPASKKSAAVKKEMQAFHRLLGEDGDGDQLLELALQRVRHRVVVKRPAKAAALAQRKPVYSLAGKAVRFDIYAVRAFDK